MQVQEHENVVVVTIIGDQCGTLWRLLEPLVGAGKKRVVLDMNQVTFLNSVNIAAIIAVRSKVTAVGGLVILARLNESIKAVFRILKLERLFELELTLDAALVAARK